MRIERRLRGARDGTAQENKSAKGLSDTRTRAFFESEIGPEFHFTYHLSQWRLGREDTGNLTYGDLIDEWLAERERRQDPAYQARLPAQGEYNLFVRGFFADPANKGRSLADAASAWNSVKFRKGSRRYRSRSMDPETEQAPLGHRDSDRGRHNGGQTRRKSFAIASCSCPAVR